jgi:hypothetical protein
MKLSRYRITAGHYECGDYTVLFGGNGHWQVRDRFGDLLACYPTLRVALAVAISWRDRGGQA